MQHLKPTQTLLSFIGAALVTTLLVTPLLDHGADGAQQLLVAQAARGTAPAAPKAAMLLADSRSAH
ncbi:MAG: hypothetical protein ING89_10465 [Rubrivivax sp.]|jgi:hypothetical protein|nr:hypothetical protein [Rubrivivax sp.]